MTVPPISGSIPERWYDAALDAAAGRDYDAASVHGTSFCLSTTKLELLLATCIGIGLLGLVAQNQVVRHEWSLTCLQCGVRARCSSPASTDRPDAVPARADIQDTSTPLSRWYSARIGEAHEHRWLRGTCTTRINVFGAGIGVACSPAVREPILEQEELVSLVRRLEEHGLDRAFHSLVAHEDPRVRAVAWQARHELDMYDRKTVERWWKRIKDRVDSSAPSRSKDG